MKMRFGRPGLLGNPGVSEGLLNVEATIWVDIEETERQILCLGGYSSPDIGVHLKAFEIGLTKRRHI